VLQTVAKGAGDVTARTLGHRNRVRTAASIGQVFKRRRAMAASA